MSDFIIWPTLSEVPGYLFLFTLFIYAPYTFVISRGHGPAWDYIRKKGVHQLMCRGRSALEFKCPWETLNRFLTSSDLRDVLGPYKSIYEIVWLSLAIIATLSGLERILARGGLLIIPASIMIVLFTIVTAICEYVEYGSSMPFAQRLGNYNEDETHTPTRKKKRLVGGVLIGVYLLTAGIGLWIASFACTLYSTHV